MRCLPKNMVLRLRVRPLAAQRRPYMTSSMPHCSLSWFHGSLSRHFIRPPRGLSAVLPLIAQKDNPSVIHFLSTLRDCLEYPVRFSLLFFSSVFDHSRTHFIPVDRCYPTSFLAIREHGAGLPSSTPSQLHSRRWLSHCGSLHKQTVEGLKDKSHPLNFARHAQTKIPEVNLFAVQQPRVHDAYPSEPDADITPGERHRLPGGLLWQ